MQMQKLKCVHKNVARGSEKKSKTDKQTFCKYYYYNIFCHLFILFGGVRVCVRGCAGYFIIFAGCMIINLHLNHRHRRRRPCLSDDWPVRFGSAFFQPFFQGCCPACGPLFGTTADYVCVCVCVDIHTTLLTTKCHMILFRPQPPVCCLLPAGHAAPATCWLLFFGSAIFSADKAVKRTFKNKIAASSTCLALGLRLRASSCDSL